MSESSDSPLILRDRLAIDRTRLANQRTLLAYLRTGLYMLVTAAAVWNLEFLKDLHWIGWIAVAVGGIVIGAGAYGYLRMKRKIDRSYEGHALSS